MPRLVLDLNDRRPVWAMPPWVPERIRAALPGDWEAVVVDRPSDGSGDGIGRVAPEVLDAVDGAEVYMGYGIPAEILRRGRSLRWVHSGAAGVGGSLTPEMLRSPVVFTNSAGIHGPPMAETVLAMILHFGRGLDLAVASQAEGVWSTDPFYAADAPLRELSRSTVGIVGFGGVGREIARRVAALGASVVALKRSPVSEGDGRLTPVGGLGDLSERLTVRSSEEDPGALDALLAASDVIVLCAPDTPETRGMIDGAALARMRDGALLVNVARGKIVEDEALVAELASGRLRGAGLDVFAREPLPEGHAFWSLPNVLITPHVSAVSSGFWERECELIVWNLGCYLRGEDCRAVGSSWRNVVDKRAGY